MFGSDFMYFSCPWELIAERSFQGTGKAIKSNMGEWLQDKYLVGTSQHNQRKLVSFLREGGWNKLVEGEPKQRETEKKDEVWRDRQDVSYMLPWFEDPLQILGSDTKFDLWPHSSNHPIIAFLQ